ncbi:LrgB family protein [Paramaledivibacter caminithermalis]|jgi:predicted murein hydrolase (TIGR00659 family)|uniref:TIGR00659 family protein n=1 Tax=Paramaledivibacter caminithermalis (strain DSM 15212 / CIP 107654 / DViRD3) TaxID=1121301 RepID=A0A1M6SIG0_PARC5|nr:LrgB family protein [Paramaledivibacter caminithermalis]SHK44552.1 TIGR00659 family protein [Paramaledivibacter caminithermalis DSM 15212]
MMEILSTPIFGVIISIVTFEIGLYMYRKTKIAIFNPLLISMILIIAFLLKFNISLEAYNKGGELISFFLGPATVILAVPLYKQFNIFKANALPIIIGITIGSITAIISVSFLSKLFGLSDTIARSLIPKSITTPIGVEVSNQIGGIPAITIAAIAVTGISGAVIGPFILKIFRIKDKVAAGVALGTASHAIGTSKAIEIGETEGAMSGLAIGIAGLITVIIVPLLIGLL